MIFSTTPSPDAIASVAHARRAVYWLDRPGRPAAMAPVSGQETADLLVVGGGFTGLWTALLAKTADPGRDVALVDGARIAEGATGRNGGFVSASLTHGLANGLARWPSEIGQLLRLGHENLSGIEATVREWSIDCDFIRSGDLQVAVEPHQVDGLRTTADHARVLGEDVSMLEADGVRARVHSPTYLAAMLDPAGVALVDPARLAWGLLEACLASGVRVFERTPVERLADDGGRLAATTRTGVVRAQRVALATNAYPPLLRRLRHFVVPVYDYVLMTEPLTDAQWSSIG